MATKSDHVKLWRKKTKERMIISMGGECQICKYDKCNNALEFHHIDPNFKDFSISSVRANPKSWYKIVDELRKCILLCSNCHKEVHMNLVKIPEVFQKFDENFSNYENPKNLEKCPICETLKPKYNKTCSLKCAAKLKHKINWDSVNLGSLLKNFNFVKIGELLGVSDSAVRKRAIKLGLYK